MLSKTLDDFEDGDVSEWNNISAASWYIDPSPTHGSFSAYLETSDGQEGNAVTLVPSELSGGQQIDQFQFYWYETSNSSGIGLFLYDSAGTEIVSVGSNNPQWVANGEEFYGGDGYQRWIRFTITFDWANNDLTVEGYDTYSGATRNISVSFSGQDVEKIGMGTPSWQTSSNEFWWVDDFSVTGLTSPPSAPQSTISIVDANDDITLSWDAPSDWGGKEGNYRVQMKRDNDTWEYPSGGPSTPDSSNTSPSYGPNSDTAYSRQVGIDSSFQFRVRAENSAGSSDWSYLSTVYTDPIPPHNPSVSRPDANTIEISWTDNSDIADKTALFYRKDTGSGYGSWNYTDSISVTSVSKGSTRTVTASVANDSWMEEDARYQFRLRHEHVSAGRDSKYVYSDYGNSGNVFFADDFEDGDLAEWDSTNGGTVKSGGHADTGISGADSGTYYFAGTGVGSNDATWLQKDLGDLSNETDVIVKCAFAVGSLDDSAENFGIQWYDGSSWQPLEHFHWEYQKQGWFEVAVRVPDSYLSTNNHIRVGTTTSSGMYGGDFFAVDRVVVSDICHEYTKPAAPSNLSLDASTEGEITADWAENLESFYQGHHHHAEIAKAPNWSDNADGYPTSPPYTFTSLDDGEKYNIDIQGFVQQPRHGSHSSWWGTDVISGSATTLLPAPTNVSVSNIGINNADVSWTDNANNEDAYRVYISTDGGSSWTDDSGQLASNTESYSLSGLSEATTYDTKVRVETEHTYSESE